MWNLKMSKSIHVTISRPDVSTVWPFFIFYEANANNFDVLDDTGKCKSYMKGNPESDLVLYVHHIFEDEAFYETYKDTANQHIPLWKTSANASEVDAYMTENNITAEIEEQTNPSLAGYVIITDIPLENPPEDFADFYANK